MKINILLTFLLTASYVLGQSNLETKISKQACNCFEGYKNSRIINEVNFEDCFINSIIKDSMALMDECKTRFGDTTAEVAYKYGLELAERLSVKLIWDCDVYFHLMDSMRYQSYEHQNPDSLKRKLSLLNSMDSASMSPDLRFKESGFWCS
ncbi:MAG: hypothetical protein J7497_16410 [Chitinophagaceae bacterium]|nr:hypothetical protein [Chitinophagaceae bacterium]